MKIQSLLALMWMAFMMCAFSACSNSDEKEMDLPFDKKENIFLKDFREEVRGEWEIDKMVIAKRYIFSDTHNDSIITDLGSIFINNIYNDPVCADKYNQLEAYFYIDNEIIPFKSKLLCLPNLCNADIKEVSGFIESAYSFPGSMNSNDFPKEYQFLDRYFFRDSYIMALSEDGKTWSWKGLNRFIREIVLTRK